MKLLVSAGLSPFPLYLFHIPDGFCGALDAEEHYHTHSDLRPESAHKNAISIAVLGPVLKESIQFLGYASYCS